MPRLPSTGEIRNIAAVSFPETPPPSALRAIAKSARQYASLTVRILDDIGDPLEETWEMSFSEFAVAVAQMAVDLHNGGFLWRVVEERNRELFGTPLPFFFKEGDAPLPAFETLDVRRFQFFIYSIFLGLKQGYPFSPSDPVLRELAEIAVRQFSDLKGVVPDTARAFLEAPLDAADAFDGAGYKRKLLWFGRHSYLLSFAWSDFSSEYFENIKEEVNAETIEVRFIACQDKFVAEHVTYWGGLSLVEFFANTLGLDAETRADILAWRGRHDSLFRIESVVSIGVLPGADPGESSSELIVKNLLTDVPYTVLLNTQMKEVERFKVGVVVWGMLQPWRGKWRWSGGQHLIYDAQSGGDPLEKVQHLAAFSEKFKASIGNKRYIFDDKLRASAEESERLMHESFVRFFGSDLAVFANTAEFSEKMRDYIGNYQQERVKTLGIEAPYKTFTPTLPSSAAKHAHRPVAVFNEIIGGSCVLTSYDALVSALKNEDDAVWEGEEEDILTELLYSSSFSPEFLERMLEKNGDAGLACLFLDRDIKEITAEERKLLVNFLTHFFKGEFFYKRYPDVIMVKEKEE
ncbi:MAG: DUF3843 family protein [Puniceicoccales bacterium]|jgi:hypothetical protein|nr:DUF3843 family protein [Puniceicoccales bacterium]